MKTRIMIAAVLQALTVAASTQAQTARDSAGIRIVDNPRPLWKPAEVLRLSDAPTLVVGYKASPEYTFGRIRQVTRMSDGRIFVADGASMQLRFFDARGVFLSAAAGKGEAPGQLRDMGLVRVLRGDTIAVGVGLSDGALFTPQGQYMRTLNTPRADGGGPPRAIMMDMLSNATRVMMPLSNPAPRAPGTEWTDSVNFSLVGTDHNVIRDLGRLPYMVFVQENAKSYTYPWLSSIAVTAASAEHFYFGFGDRYAVNVYSPSGQLQSIFRRAWTPIPVTPADWENWVVEWSKLWIKSTGDSARKKMQELRDAPYAFTMPAFSQFIPDRIGRLWVREAHYQDAISAGSLTDPPVVPSKWSVFAAKGVWLGDVTMPKDFQPYDIGADYVLGKQYVDGVSKVVQYALIAGGKR